MDTSSGAQELAGLRRVSVSLPPGEVPSLRVTSTIERSNGTCRVKEYGKSEAARRTLKMPASVAKALSWHLGAFPDDEWVFSAPKGGYLRYDNFRDRVWGACNRGSRSRSAGPMSFGTRQPL